MYLGFDLSTQSLKCVALEETRGEEGEGERERREVERDGEREGERERECVSERDRAMGVVLEESVVFERDISPESLSSFSPPSSSPSHSYIPFQRNGDEVTSSVFIWIAAIEILLSRLKEKGVMLQHVRSIGVTAQQHGSVWWRKGSEEILRGSDPSLSLQENLRNAFSLTNSPIWMDGSTKEEVSQMEEFFGGPDSLCECTGSRAFERFTGPQIRKILWKKPQEFSETERVSLVSSFLVSLFLGCHAPIDPSDGSGMNLMDIKTKKLSEKALSSVLAPPPNEQPSRFQESHLRSLIGEPAAEPLRPLGTVSRYMQSRFGFPSDCLVFPGSGDNPSSMIGLGIEEEGVTMVSLGTSDTLCSVTPNPVWSQNVSTFCLAGNPNLYMTIFCFKNGSNSREHFRDDWLAKGQCGDFPHASWKEFNEHVKSVPAGCNGHVGVYNLDEDIIPPRRRGVFRMKSDGKLVSRRDDEVAMDCRALIESRFLSMLAHASDLNLKVSKIVATGGAAANDVILQTLSDIFGVTVESRNESVNSAAIGSALLGARGYYIQNLSKDEAPKKVFHLSSTSRVFYPNMEAHKIYREQNLPLFRVLCEEIEKSSKEPESEFGEKY